MIVKNILLQPFGLQKKIELKLKLLEHPPYSPDLAPSDFHLFLSNEEEITTVEAYFADHSQIGGSLYQVY